MIPKDIKRLSPVRFRRDNKGIKTIAAVFIARYDKPEAVRIRINDAEHIVRTEEVWQERDCEKHVLLDEHGRVFELWAGGETNCAEISRQMADIKPATVRRVVKKGIGLGIIAPKSKE